ncbi:MAG TPA: cation diffusion facilitator family transporter [Rubrobacteraceae bacterium]|nr:cation diffusion facilitator family transporter [Rubrobacteraceae bacterium]
MTENKGKDSEEKGTKRSVIAAFIANFLIAIAKFVAGFISGSAAMLAEGAHSVADTVNQLFLLVSLPLSKSGPDREHPYGYGKDRFFWSLLVAFGLFVAGGVFSIYEGVTKITGELEGGESYTLAYIVLGAAFLFEAAALIVSIREFRQAAREENRSFWDYFKITRNTTLKVPLYEDAAALTGLIIAAAGLFLTQTTGVTLYDGLASIGIGVVLMGVAWELGTDSRRLLLGEAVPPEDEQRLRETIASFDEVTECIRLLTMHLGPNSVLVNAEIHVVDGLDTDQIEDLLERITQALRDEMPEVAHTFIELHPPGKPGQSAPKNGR